MTIYSKQTQFNSPTNTAVVWQQVSRQFRDLGLAKWHE